LFPFVVPCRWLLSTDRTDEDLTEAEEMANLLRRTRRASTRVEEGGANYSSGLGDIITMLKVMRTTCN
jgi:hypothetical protein